MARFNIERISSDFRARYREEFCRLIARMPSLEGVRDFAWDMFSTKEIVMFMRRIAVARLLMAHVPQIEITRKTGFSRMLISRMHDRLMRNGNGFAIAAKAMKSIDEELDVAVKREHEGADPIKPEFYIRRYTRAFAAEHLLRGAEDALPYAIAAAKRKRTLKKRNT